ncbi:unnamed protein product [Amoebophrya sp. A25]|nr:unnamed protein product [Amoebophrya sp. A25]|eukprot:GSA25T00021106001.1
MAGLDTERMKLCVELMVRDGWLYEGLQIALRWEQEGVYGESQIGGASSTSAACVLNRTTCLQDEMRNAKIQTTTSKKVSKQEIIDNLILFCLLSAPNANAVANALAQEWQPAQLGRLTVAVYRGWQALANTTTRLTTAGEVVSSEGHIRQNNNSKNTSSIHKYQGPLVPSSNLISKRQHSILFDWHEGLLRKSGPGAILRAMFHRPAISEKDAVNRLILG